jgi:hypothetical protein
MTGDIPIWAGVVVAAVSLVVAIVALEKSCRAQREAKASQWRIVEVEEQREHDGGVENLQAILRPELRKMGSYSYRLYVVNRGASEARHIRVEVDGRPLSECDTAVKNDPLPESMGPHSEISCRFALHLQDTPPFKMKLTWDDYSGPDRSYCTTLM